jgi:Rrf2 family protein
MHLQANEEYGLRCLLQVASAGPADGAADPAGVEPVPIAEIARAEGLSVEYTAKLMRQLRLAGLVESVRGASGGYRLAQPAQAVTVWHALRALGGEPFPEDFCACHPGQQRECVRSTDCALRALWRTLKRDLKRTLQAITLDDLRRDERTMTVWLDDGSPAGRAFRDAFPKETPCS